MAYLGTYTRYTADDYCSASACMTDGFWGAQWLWYRGSSGSVTFNFAITALATRRLGSCSSGPYGGGPAAFPVARDAVRGIGGTWLG